MYFAKKQVAQMMTPQNKMEANNIGSPNHGSKNGLNKFEQVRDEIGDVQRFCDSCLVTHFKIIVQTTKKTPIHKTKGNHLFMQSM